jgi:hypothetical protein
MRGPDLVVAEEHPLAVIALKTSHSIEEAGNGAAVVEGVFSSGLHHDRAEASREIEHRAGSSGPSSARTFFVGCRAGGASGRDAHPDTRTPVRA